MKATMTRPSVTIPGNRRREWNAPRQLAPTEWTVPATIDPIDKRTQPEVIVSYGNEHGGTVRPVAITIGNRVAILEAKDAVAVAVLLLNCNRK